MTTREQAFTALFALLQSLAPSPATIVQRKFVYLEDVSGAAQCPMVILTTADETITERQNLPPVRKVGAEIFVYVWNPNKSVSAAPQLNNLIDAIFVALAPKPGFETQTLGDVVDRAWIEGRIAKYEAPDNTKAAALIPVQMLVP
jgi:hypothetical protein